MNVVGYVCMHVPMYACHRQAGKQAGISPTFIHTYIHTCAPRLLLGFKSFSEGSKLQTGNLSDLYMGVSENRGP